MASKSFFFLAFKCFLCASSMCVALAKDYARVEENDFERRFIQSEGIRDLINPNSSHSSNSEYITHVAKYITPFGYDYHGTKASIAVYGPEVKPGQRSGAYIAIVNRNDQAPEQANAIMIGWVVEPSAYHDYRTHIFTKWTVDNFGKTGCRDQLCPGFVAVNETGFGPGSSIYPVTTPGEPKYYFTFKIFKEQSSGNWWWYYSPAKDDENFIPIGYWPNHLFTSMKDSARWIIWGGLVSYNKGEPGPAMGSGHFPDDGEKLAAVFTDIRLVYPNGSYYYLDDQLKSQNTQEKCYKLGIFLNYHFLYGGPGGCVD